MGTESTEVNPASSTFSHCTEVCYVLPCVKRKVNVGPRSESITPRPQLQGASREET